MGKVIIDVREPNEYANAHVSGAVNWPVNQINESMNGLQDLAKDSQIIVYCQSGHRSGMAMQKLKSFGYTNVINGINKTEVESKYL